MANFMLITNYSPAGGINNSANKTKILLQNTPFLLGNYQVTQLKQDTFTPTNTKHRDGMALNKYFEEELQRFLNKPAEDLTACRVYGFLTCVYELLSEEEQALSLQHAKQAALNNLHSDEWAAALGKLCEIEVLLDAASAEKVKSTNKS
jgi:hypothetical protein